MIIEPKPVDQFVLGNTHGIYSPVNSFSIVEILTSCEFEVNLRSFEVRYFLQLRLEITYLNITLILSILVKMSDLH